MDNQSFHWVATPSTAGTLAGTPVADYAAGGTKSDIVSFAKYKTAYFQIILGARVGTTAASVITAIPCDDAAASNETTAISFDYKRVSATDTNAAWTTASTLTTTTGDDQAYIVRVRAENLPLVSGVKYEYAYVNITEDADDPQVGAVLIMMSDPRYNEDVTDTVTS